MFAPGTRKGIHTRRGDAEIREKTRLKEPRKNGGWGFVRKHSSLYREKLTWMAKSLLTEERQEEESGVSPGRSPWRWLTGESGLGGSAVARSIGVWDSIEREREGRVHPPRFGTPAPLFWIGGRGNKEEEEESWEGS